MPEIVERRSNLAPWAALLLVVGAVALNMGLLFGLPGGPALLWLGLLLALAALAWSAVGVKRAFGQPQMYRGKISSAVFAFLAIAVCALLTFGWFQARALPRAGEAPQVGQKAPEFTLADTQGNKVSLAQLLGHGDAGATRAAAPKAVLLIFYRGYW
jgi:hypothetical protein